ncbi:3-hydroxyacyl-CoA dehydrogenase NAD-binding domain-containing protein [Rhizobium leguminosarum]|jgi:3-hydroxyacyl-CoA dehydrogenase
MSAQSGRERFSKVVCVGAGNIGAGWVAHFLRAGLEMVVYDLVRGLIEAYADEVRRIGSVGQKPLIETRTDGIIGIRNALQSMRENLAERGGILN